MNIILLIDDDVDLVDSYSEYLTSNGYKIITAYTGKEGIELYRKYSPCMVFSDIKMPDMDGYELFSKIMEINNLAKIMLSSQAMKIKIKLFWPKMRVFWGY